MRALMSLDEPPPSTIVQLSLSIVTFLAPQVGERHLLEIDAQFFHDRLPAGEDRDVLEHRLAPIAEARGLHRGDLQHAAELVHHQRRGARPRSPPR